MMRAVIAQYRAALLAIRDGRYCWCRFWHHGEAHSPGCVLARLLTHYEYGDDPPLK